VPALKAREGRERYKPEGLALKTANVIEEERVRAAGNNLAGADMEDYLGGLEEATFAGAQLHYGAQLQQLGLLVLLQRAGAEASPAPPSPTSTPGCSLSTAQARQCI